MKLTLELKRTTSLNNLKTATKPLDLLWKSKQKLLSKSLNKEKHCLDSVEQSRNKLIKKTNVLLTELKFLSKQINKRKKSQKTTLRSFSRENLTLLQSLLKQSKREWTCWMSTCLISSWNAFQTCCTSSSLKRNRCLRLCFRNTLTSVLLKNQVSNLNLQLTLKTSRKSRIDSVQVTTVSNWRPFA